MIHRYMSHCLTKVNIKCRNKKYIFQNKKCGMCKKKLIETINDIEFMGLKRT